MKSLPLILVLYETSGNGCTFTKNYFKEGNTMPSKAYSEQRGRHEAPTPAKTPTPRKKDFPTYEELQAMLAAAEDELAEAKKKAKDLERDLKAAEKKAEDAEKRAERANKKLDDSGEKTAEKVKKLAADLDEAKKAADEATKRAEKAEERAAVAEAKIEELNTQISAKSAELAAVRKPAADIDLTCLSPDERKEAMEELAKAAEICQKVKDKVATAKTRSSLLSVFAALGS